MITRRSPEGCLCLSTRTRDLFGICWEKPSMALLLVRTRSSLLFYCAVPQGFSSPTLTFPSLCIPDLTGVRLNTSPSYTAFWFAAISFFSKEYIYFDNGIHKMPPPFECPAPSNQTESCTVPCAEIINAGPDADVRCPLFLW